MSDGLKAIYKLSAKIERLEAELERVSDQLNETLGLYAQDQAELADWQRHGVKVTEDCDCDGCDVGHHIGASGGGRLCSRCGGTGKKPRDGVERLSVADVDFDIREDGYFIPVEWLEAE